MHSNKVVFLALPSNILVVVLQFWLFLQTLFLAVINIEDFQLIFHCVHLGYHTNHKQVFRSTSFSFTFYPLHMLFFPYKILFASLFTYPSPVFPPDISTDITFSRKPYSLMLGYMLLLYTPKVLSATFTVVLWLSVEIAHSFLIFLLNLSSFGQGYLVHSCISSA